MKNLFLTFLIVLAAITTMSSSSVAGQYDGVWEGEMVSETSPIHCGFKKRKITLKADGDKITGEWRDATNVKVKLSGKINNDVITFDRPNWKYVTTATWTRSAKLNTKAKIIGNKITGSLRVGNSSPICDAKFTLTNTLMEPANKVVALKAESDNQTEILALKLRQLQKTLKEKQTQEELNKEIVEAERKVEAIRRETERQETERQETERQETERNAAKLKAAKELALKEELRRKKNEAQIARLNEKRKKQPQIVAASSTTFNEKRVALVIGNGNYPQVGVLANPPNDARLMTRTLRQVGFDVVESIDADQKAMKRAISSFGKKLDEAGKDAVGLFYYAGHGVQVSGNNYLIPVNVNINNESDVDIEAVSANVVQGKMAFAGNRLNIIIMDACRNNPFKRGFRSAARGLARMSATTGTLIAYATGPGDVAADGSGTNSPYTKALAKAILTPGLAVERVFKEVRNSVVAATNDNQTPWESSSLTGGDFFFSGGASTGSQVQQVNSSPLPNVDKEAMFWDAIKSSKDAEDFAAYLEEYPNGSFATLARVKKRKYSK
jgi:hypothetical protein